MIMSQTRHKNASTLRKYVRLGSLFQQNAAARAGLYLAAVPADFDLQATAGPGAR